MKTDIIITNSELARITERPISKVRRNTKEFLPPDPQASRRSGYSRRFKLDDAFKVMVGTHLVSILVYSFSDARTIIADIWPWVESVNLLPGKTTPRTGIDKEVINYVVQIRNDAQNGGFHYIVNGDVLYNNIKRLDPVRGDVELVSKQTYSYEFTPRDSHAVSSPSIPELYVGDSLIFKDEVYVEVTKRLHISELLRSFKTAIDKL
jgi:hypothetical protein